MEIKKGQAGKWQVLSLEGRLDITTAPQLEQVGTSFIEEGAYNLALDFNDLAYISSAGLRVILIMGKKTKALGGQLILCGLHDMVAEIMEESGLSALFNTYAALSDLE